MSLSTKKPAPEKRRRKMVDQGAIHIRRTWGDVDVVDADKDLRVFIAPEDVKAATKKDPGYCVFAQACRRLFHTTKVLFFRQVAYIEMPNESGVRRVERFVMGKSMRNLIESFDQGKGVIPEGGFLLRAPTPAHRLDIKAARGRAADVRRKLEGRTHRSVGQRGKVKYADEPIVVDLSVRNGTGAVHFTRRANP